MSETKENEKEKAQKKVQQRVLGCFLVLLVALIPIILMFNSCEKSHEANQEIKQAQSTPTPEPPELQIERQAYIDKQIQNGTILRMSPPGQRSASVFIESSSAFYEMYI